MALIREQTGKYDDDDDDDDFLMMLMMRTRRILLLMMRFFTLLSIANMQFASDGLNTGIDSSQASQSDFA